MSFECEVFQSNFHDTEIIFKTSILNTILKSFCARRVPAKRKNCFTKISHLSRNFFFGTFSQNLAKKAKVKGYCYEWEITYIPFSRFENLLCLDSEPLFPKCWNLSIKKILYLKLKKLSWELVLNKTINWRMLSILWQIFKYKEHAFSPILGLAFCCKGFSGAVNLAKYNPGVFSR